MFKRLWQMVRGSYFSVGIEISDLSIKLVQLKFRRGRNPEIIQVLEEPLEPTTVDDGKIKEVLQLNQAIQTMIARLEAKPDYVHCVLPSQLIMVRFLKVPDVPGRDIRRLVDFEVKNNIHLPFQNPMFDVVKINGEDWSGRSGLAWLRSWLPQMTAAPVEFPKGKLPQDLLPMVESEPEKMADVMLVATSRDYVESYTESLKTARLPITSLEIKALSIMRYIQKTEFIPSMATFLIVDINSLTTDLSIYHNGFLGITRNVPINFQETEAAILDVGDNEALKMAMQIARDASFQTHCNDLAYEVERLMSFYRYSLNHQQFEKFDYIIVIGEMFRLKDAVANLSRSLSTEVLLLKPTNLENAEIIQETYSSFAVSLGLALRGDER